MDAKNFIELQEQLNTWSLLLFEHYTQLLDKGFSKEEAIYLTGQFQNQMLINMSKNTKAVPDE